MQRYLGSVLASKFQMHKSSIHPRKSKRFSQKGSLNQEQIWAFTQDIRGKAKGEMIQVAFFFPNFIIILDTKILILKTSRHPIFFIISIHL